MNAATIFSEALQKKDSERAKFLNQACQDDAKLRAEVDELLQAHVDAGEFLNLDATMPAAAVTEQAGDLIGPYKLLQQIGEGGFGVVYMAEQTEPVRRKVALKIIKPGMDTREVIARFEAERQALALMDHPNIAKVLGGGSTETGRPYFVMELIKGIPITKFCDENKLDTHQRLVLFGAVCRAIQHAHQKGVIHRDIKPTNVLVTLHDGQPVPKVIDFGVAKAISQQLTEKTMFTAFGQMIGTPQYMSPEQAEMSGLDVDTRSDIYSLGVLLYELLTGSTPLDPLKLRETAFHELQRMIREEEAVRPSVRLTTQGEHRMSIAARRSTVPDRLGALVRGDLDWIVMKSLEKNREQRYESPSALAADVERFLNQEAVTACPPSALYRFRKFARRNTAAIATTTAIAGSLILGMSVAVCLAVLATHERDRAVEAELLAQSRLQSEQQERTRAEDAEVSAIDEAERAEVILAFLNDSVFARAIPFTQKDRDISLRTILQQIPTDNSEWASRSPLAEASIRHYLGVTCGAVGLIRESLLHLDRALELRRERLGDDHIDTASTKTYLAGYELVLGQAVGKLKEQEAHFSRADELGTAAVETLTKKLGRDHAESLHAACALAMISHFRGDQDRALKIYRQIRDSLPGTSDRNIYEPLDLRRSVGLIIRREEVGSNSDVDQIIAENYAQACRELPERHPHRLFWTTWCGIMLMQRGRLVEADELLTDALEKRIAILHPMNNFIWLGNRTLAGLRVRQDRRDEAIDLLRFGRKSRPSDKSTALGLGCLLLDRGKPTDREEWLKLSKQILDYHENTGHPETAYQVALLTLAVPPQSDDEREAQQRAIKLVGEVAQWAEHEPPGVLLHPELMRSSILLVHAIAQYRDGDVQSGLSLFSEVEQESSMMCRAIALAHRAVIERQNGNSERVQELIDQAHTAAAAASPEELDDTGQHLWNRRILFELAIREAKMPPAEIAPADSNIIDDSTSEREPQTSSAKRAVDDASEFVRFWKGEFATGLLPLSAAPKQHKVVFENEYVRVFRVTNPPGGVAPPHVHVWPSVVIMDEPADLVIRNESGTVRRHVKAEERPVVTFNEPTRSPYSVQNVDDHPIRLWRVEIKQLPNPKSDLPTETD